VPEVQRLWQAQDEPRWRQALRLRWSRFRRAHQAVAKRCHVTRRARQHPLAADRVIEPIHLAGLPTLTPERWDQLCPLLPQQAATGRPAVEHRLIVEGILWIIRTGSAWRELPERFGSWQTVASRYQRWRKEGRWARMLQVLQQPAVPITSSA
jgi:Putative transposase of IS4/5 family (DUF4096)